MSSNKRQRQYEIPQCHKRIKVLENEIETLKIENKKMKYRVYMIESTKHLQNIDIMSYKYLINGRVDEILNYIALFVKNKEMCKDRIFFMINNCYELITDVYKRHTLSFKKEYKKFNIVVDFFLELCEKKKLYSLLYNANYKLFKIYNLMKDNKYKFDSYVSLIYFSFKLGDINYSKTLIRNMKFNLDLNNITEEDEEYLQNLKDDIYE